MQVGLNINYDLINIYNMKIVKNIVSIMKNVVKYYEITIIECILIKPALINIIYKTNNKVAFWYL
jgi:hypothetical protein